MSSAAREHLRVELVDGIAVVGFVDREFWEEAAIQEVGEQLYSLVEESGFRKILLNLSNIDSMSTSMLAKIFGMSKRIEKVDGELKLCCPSPLVEKGFSVTGLDRIFEIFDDEMSALEDFDP